MLETEIIKSAGDSINKQVKLMLLVLGSILVLGILAFATYKIIQKIKSGKSKEYINDLKKEAKGVEPTLSETQAISIAASLWNGLQDFWVSEDLIISSIRKVKNIADWSIINEKFGTKTIDMNISTNLKVGNLVEWLNDRLDTDEFFEVQNILNSNGITI